MGERTRVWIRWATWLAMVFVVGAIVIIAVQRSRLLRPAVVRLGAPSGEGGGQAVGVSEGFEFTESVSGKTLFILNAARTLGLSSGWTRIEDVRFRWFGQDDSQVELSCDSARFNPQTRDAELIGAVHIRLPSGAFMDTPRGHFDASTQSVRSETHVVFSDGETVGEAGNALYVLSTGKVVLGGGVVVGERSGRILKAPSVRFDRRSGWATFPEGIDLAGPSMRVTAPRATVKLDEEKRDPRQIVLEGGVHIRSATLPEGGSFTAWAEKIRAIRDAGGQWQVLATTSGPWVELNLVDTPDSVLRRLQNWRLLAVVGDEGPIKAVFETRLCVEDVPRRAMPRWASATGGQLWFENGDPASFEMTGEVWLRVEGYTVTGDTARFLANEEKVIISSDPAQRRRATVRSGDLQVSAERVEGLRGGGSVHAEGDVQGIVTKGSFLGATSAREAGGPIRFASDRLDIKEGGGAATLRGGARIWQAERLLLADEITMHRAGERLEAAGNVRLTVPARQFNPDAPEGKEALIIAQSLVYDRKVGTIEIQGNVRYMDPMYLMSCSALQAKLGEKNRVDVIDAEGNVDIQDLVENRHMQGEKAHYEQATRLLEMTGHPVRLLDSKNNLITGSSLTWDRAAGTVSISGGEGSPTETIYHPEEVH